MSYDEKQILKLYYSPSFPGSLRGASVFQRSLKNNVKIDIPLNKLRQILKASETYQTNVRKNYARVYRPIHGSGSFIEVASDVGKQH